MKKKYDVVIVGGGVIGANLAYYLSQESLDVLLLEKGDICSGTSSGCDGNVLISDKQPGLDTLMTYESQKLLKELAAEIPHDFEYVQPGSLLVIESPEELEVAQEFVEAQVKDGYPMRILDRDALLEQEPHFAPDVLGGVEIDCDAALNPMLFTYALLLEAQKRGVDVLTHCPVQDIVQDQNGFVQKVITPKGSIQTHALVNCAGVWAPEIGAMVGIDIPIKPRQGQLLVTEQTQKIAKRKVMEFGYLMAKFGSSTYKRNIRPELDQMGIALVLEPTHSDNFLIGSSRAFKGFDKEVTIEVMAGIAERAMRFFPILEEAHVIRAYSGLRPYVTDHLPIVSCVREVPNFYIAAGHEGDGIGLAPITGKIVRQMLLDEEAVLPIEHLSYQRFQN